MRNKADFLAVDVVIDDEGVNKYYPAMITREMVLGFMDLSQNKAADLCQIMINDGQLCNSKKSYAAVKSWLFDE